MITCRSAVSSPSLNDACTRPASMNTESSGPSSVESRSRYCVIRPRLTMIISSWPGWRWRSWPSPGSSFTSITTICFAPVVGTHRQPITPQSNCSSSTSLFFTNLLISLLRVRSAPDRLEPAHVLGHGDLRRQALHARRPEESDNSGGPLQHVGGVLGLGDRAAVAQHDHFRVDRLGCVVHLLDGAHAFIERARGV